MKAMPDRPFADTEKGYRLHYLQADIKLARRIILVWLIAVVFFIPVDYAVHGSDFGFVLLLIVRLIFIACITAIVVALNRVVVPDKFDLLVGLVLFLGVSFDFLGSVLYPQDYIVQIIISLLVIVTIYAVFPGPLTPKVIACLLITGKTIGLIFNHRQTLGGSLYSLGTIILIANVLGYYCWRAIAKSRRQEYAVQMELEDARNKAEYLARMDPLTGVNNRRAFIEFGWDEFLRSRRYQRPLSLAMIDIDNFKPLNDRYGHRTGDQILKLFSQTVNKHIRDQDVLGRLGGDEFALMLPETTIQDAQSIVMRLAAYFRDGVVPFENLKVSTSFSAGVACMQSSDQSFEQLLERADQKLYLAKNTGKRRVAA